MSKKTIVSLLACLLILSSCNAKTQDEKKVKTMDKGHKTLVAFFSATGTTKKVATMLAQTLEADLYEIKPQQPYTAQDLDYTIKTSRSSVEMNDKSSRPAIVKDLENYAQYDTVYIGFPIWWYTCPTIINTFLEQYDWQGKTFIAFATSGSSTIDGSAKDLATKYPKINWGKAKLLNNVTKEDIEQWLKEK